MKFKASFTDDGISLLDKRKPQHIITPLNPLPSPRAIRRAPHARPSRSAAGFLPAMDKVGRVCHVYLTPTHAMLLHNLLGSAGPDGDGPQCVAQFAKDLLFGEYNVSSRDANRVAFSVDVALLQRAALRSALAVHAQWPAAGDPRRSR
jgi:HUS1 checkpoint protein